jgi:putative oxidoreductase
MDVVVLIGRIVFSALFLVSSVAHLTQTDAMAGYAASKGVPAARPAVLLSGLLILAGGLMVLLGLWGDLGALFLVLFLVPTAVLIHGFWRETDATAKQMEQVQFSKDMALAGAALMVFALFAYAGNDLGLTLTGPVFDLR